MTEGCFYLECRRFLRAAKKIALKLSQKPSEQFSALDSCVFTAKFFMFGLLPESPRIPVGDRGAPVLVQYFKERLVNLLRSAAVLLLLIGAGCSIRSSSPTNGNSSASTSAAAPNATPIETPSPLSSANASNSGVISAGALDKRATNLPKPPYPPVARAAKASGPVVVQVTVDENGKVTSAKAVSGHPLLRPAAEAAARQATFLPAIVGGNYVKVSGTITYEFSAP